MDKDRLIKLLQEECEGLWQCEGTSYLDKEDSAELEKLLEEYDAEQDVSTSTFMIKLPLEMIWQPKEDITTYELAMCLPYFFRHHGVMPYEVDKSLPHFRHFKITDHNVK